LDARKFGTQRPSLFYCGDDRTAKGAVAKLGEELWFEPVDAGPLVVARYLGPLACPWMQLANNCGMGPEIAFTLICGERA
jgi:predicted dinucleotide-binding enzyme